MKNGYACLGLEPTETENETELSGLMNVMQVYHAGYGLFHTVLYTHLGPNAAFPRAYIFCIRALQIVHCPRMPWFNFILRVALMLS